MIKQSWKKRKQLLEYNFAFTNWALSIMPEIWDDVRLNLDSDKRMAIERVIAKLHVALNPNSKVAKNLDIFRMKQGSMVCTPADFVSHMH